MVGGSGIQPLVVQSDTIRRIAVAKLLRRRSSKGAGNGAKEEGQTEDVSVGQRAFIFPAYSLGSLWGYTDYVAGYENKFIV